MMQCEKQKKKKDTIRAFSTLFEEDLNKKDLTQSEKAQIMKGFSHYIHTAEEKKAKEQAKRKKHMTRILGFGGLTIVFILGIYILSAKPFMPVSKIETKLAYYYEKVESGMGTYAPSYYKLLKKYKGKLGREKVTEYSQNMYSVIEEHYKKQIEKLKNGKLSYYDDAKQWAGYFPDKQERQARKETAQNARNEGLSNAVGDTVKDLTEKASEVINEAGKLIQEKVEELKEKRKED